MGFNELFVRRRQSMQESLRLQYIWDEGINGATLEISRKILQGKQQKDVPANGVDK